MSIYCPDLKLLYIQTPCTGSTALGRFLVDHFGGVDFGGQHMVVSEAVAMWPETAKAYKFCTIRNPYDKIVTQYYKHNFHDSIKYPNDLYRWCFKNRPTFEEYVHSALVKFERVKDWSVYFPRLGKDLGDWVWIKGVDEVLPQEQIQDGIYWILRRLGVETKLVVPRQNETSGKGYYQSLHTQLSRNIVSEKYGSFMFKFGYSFHGNVRQIKL